VQSLSLARKCGPVVLRGLLDARDAPYFWVANPSVTPATDKPVASTYKTEFKTSRTFTTRGRPRAVRAES
jgi:hypothetical protein